MSVGVKARAAAVMVAAGRSRRLGLDKLWIDLWGRPVWRWSLDALLRAPELERIVVVHPTGSGERFAAMLPAASADRCLLTEGGGERIDSVLAGLKHLTAVGLAEESVVLIHDAARPAVRGDLIDRVLAATSDARGVVPVVTISDTLKRTAVEGGRTTADETVDRAGLVAAQTPQAARLGDLRDALLSAQRAGRAPTDDAAALAAAGISVCAVPGDVSNRKLTEPGDEQLLGAILRHRASPVENSGRAGIGFDAHRFEAGRRLRLGGLDWPNEGDGLAGHSDGDAALHAVIDAVLGAAGLGDIGSHFPSDPRWAAADSAELLAIALARVRAAGWTPAWVDLVVVAARPPIGPRRAEIRERIAALLDVPADAVSVKATTSDGLGFSGPEGIAAHAVAGVERSG